MLEEPTKPTDPDTTRHVTGSEPTDGGYARRRDPRTQVLIVEDDLWARRVVADTLRAAGFAVAEASNGFTGLHVAERDRPDVVLLDLALPEISGCDVLHLLKVDPSTRDIPVVAVSSFAEPLVRSGCCEADATLPKPVDGEAVARVVEEVAPHAR